MMPPAIRLLVDLLQAPPSLEWWIAELGRILGFFEDRLDAYASFVLRDQVTKARTHSPEGFDLDGVASGLRGLFQTDADPAVQEQLHRLDFILARLGYAWSTGIVGQMVARRLAAPPADGLDDPEALIQLRREMGEITL